MSKFIDITNQRFSHLVALEYVGLDRHNNTRWLCRCDCGRTIVTLGFNLRTGRTKSCRCVTKARKHGYANHPLYQTWSLIWHRCYNPNTSCYANYGGRGIKLCKKWHSVVEFINDVTAEIGPRPTNYSLDRINNDGHYKPGNIKWSTASEQALNRRKRMNIHNFSDIELINELKRRGIKLTRVPSLK